ncbi:acetyl/propionyl/methylcrotonyl-CoA carboxylase subunit alpha [Thalassotalea psychrophila]|uniref:Acetyl/propionyl/methylcrotonyl-CoA carboxylase subunit alpha n=1 Tax=Thalassotalea psychrophila TaxID=3065647 RepID=A0ABY9TZA7_9GAMM|nr:acetyl/propionyl/methylcrotonyl-CoA carboxylase subunit alpha [Colwelliaceae bacterium SQ149]
MTNFSKILIANRGEIAVRVISTAKAMGYRTVAVYSEADATALHVQMADQAVLIGAPAVNESYLVAEKLIDAAERTGADAIHPGYGFLSENANFAQLCAQHNITFIGPSAEAIELMGSKRLSKIAMLEAGVPCIPGYQGAEQSDQCLLREADKIGFPLMIKASAGGGGRGMRLVFDPNEVAAALKSARSEALSAFANGELILERAVMQPRHIEIQIFADNAGNTVYLGERDCSIQRRHQKVVEEAPSPFVDENLRQKMGTAAVNAAKACNYAGAGTVEFLVDSDGQFYFLEMNTRLQVEHPVTELITGLDLVAWQLKVAAGEQLPLTQQQVKLNGHAMEVRLYAEDPSNNFMPQTGEALTWQLPEQDGVRIDHGICQGQTISPHYDPMLAKIITFGENRQEARRKLICTVEDTVLLGVNNNKRFLSNILKHEVFAQGQATTAFIEQHFADDCSLHAGQTSIKTQAIAAILMHEQASKKTAASDELLSLQNGIAIPWHYVLTNDSEEYALKLEIDNSTAPSFTVSSATESITLEIVEIGKTRLKYLHNNILESIPFVFNQQALFIDAEFGNSCFENITHAPVSAKEKTGSGKIQAPMDGAIVEVMTRTGQQVSKGESIVVLEAMKMEHTIKADIDGVIESIHTSAGEQVKNKQLLVTIANNNNDQ